MPFADAHDARSLTGQDDLAQGPAGAVQQRRRTDSDRRAAADGNLFQYSRGKSRPIGHRSKGKKAGQRFLGPLTAGAASSPVEPDTDPVRPGETKWRPSANGKHGSLVMYAGRAEPHANPRHHRG